MAFVAVNSHALARELWPSGIGKLQQDKQLTLQNLPASRIVPKDSDDLLRWLFVQLVERGRRAHVFMHPSVDGAKGSPEVVLRLQGVIEDANMGLYGDWDQTETNAKKAMQRLVLGSGGCREAFAPQLKALDDIRQTVNVDTGASVVTEDEDPSGLLDTVADKWRITTRTKCGYENGEDGIESLNGLSLRPGDMVDVSVTVVGVIVDGQGGKRCDVVFEPKTVVRLASGAAVQDAFEAASREAAIAR
ncbi:hypothetical protein GSI_02773 [Ganoderma sinense ZZ0214-1]|uniref:Uncharacterized protein n=1 Tax=Ganoderma sinense ZZ0214-1 TaxID=1077348 RepID=A0A2G8SMJ3_9APHY|nr:hypothetical protein GSI_02773 [Ganoderma sinense ZZ0214-1]